MSLRISFLSRKFSKSFREFKIKDEDQETRDQLVPYPAELDGGSESSSSWSYMLPELLGEIIKRVEGFDNHWSRIQNVVACACVCKCWRHVTKEIVRSSTQNGKITFPSCLKQPGPPDFPNQCLIRRDKKTATFYLYLAFTPTFTEKFLLAARRYRRGAHTEYIISLDDDDISQGSNAYVGKLSSDFLGTNLKPLNSRSSRRFASKQISPQIPASNFMVGHVSYKFNLLKSRGPRRMQCSLNCPMSDNAANDNKKKPVSDVSGCTVLRNKAPRWHEHFQCWCLNFHGRVTVASVKNFQLVAVMDPSHPGGKGDEETILLHFGKVGDDTFTMDYRRPLSAFQAFAICLTSFGTKLACQ